MDAATHHNETRNLFNRPADVAAYAKRYGRRELEVMLTSGMLSPQCEQLVAVWLLRDEQREQRWTHWPLWASGAIGAVLLVALLDKLF